MNQTNKQTQKTELKKLYLDKVKYLNGVFDVMRILLLEKKKKKKVFMKEDPEMMEKKTRLDYDSTYDM